jgi:hypothetical protein
VSQLPISVLVKLRESRSQVCNLGLRDAGGDVSQSALAKLGLVHVLLHISDHLGIQLNQVVLFVPFLLDPRMVEGLLSSESHVG